MEVGGCSGFINTAASQGGGWALFLSQWPGGSRGMCWGSAGPWRHLCLALGPVAMRGRYRSAEEKVTVRMKAYFSLLLAPVSIEI